MFATVFITCLLGFGAFICLYIASEIYHVRHETRAMRQMKEAIRYLKHRKKYEVD
jgi:hypothetical protein